MVARDVSSPPLDAARTDFKKGSGLPIRLVPVIEMIEMRGRSTAPSRARIDSGLLKGRDRQRRADTGPACYEQGGHEHDGDRLPLYVLRAPRSRVLFGGPLCGWTRRRWPPGGDDEAPAVGGSSGSGAHEAAWGITECVNENMARPPRASTGRARQGSPAPSPTNSRFRRRRDRPRVGVGRISGSPGVLRPVRRAGAVSALRSSCAPLAFDFVRNRPQRIDPRTEAAINALCAEMERQAGSF